MEVSRSLVGLGLTLAASALLTACATSGGAASEAETPETAPAQAGTTLRRDAFVLTSAEIAAAPGVQNAFDAVQQLRPHFLRARGAVAATAGGLLGRGATRATGRSGGQGQGAGAQPAGSDNPTGPERASASMPEDVGILVYLDRQRYGRIHTLREIPASTIDEIRFLNVGEANSEFGMGHPHGVIQVISKRGPSQ